MFARVVPALRTPIGVEYFDYSIPEGMEIVIGEIVLVPFRRRSIPALVVDVMASSPYAEKAKPVFGSYGGLRFPPSMVGLLEWTSRWTFSSRPTVLSAWVRRLPKRIPELQRVSWPERAPQPVRVSWSAESERLLIEKASEALHDGKRVLIVTPQKATASRYAAALSNARLLLSDLADGAAFRAWSEWQTEGGALVSTRVGAWLAPCADLVLLDQPEQDDHKQDELTPRYDARKLVIWSAQHAGSLVEAIGITPTLASEDPAPSLNCRLQISVRHPQARSAIPMMQADTLNTIRDHEGPRIIIHPIRGQSARFTCRDCGWQAMCPSCGFPTSAIGGLAVCRRCGWKGDAPIQCGACGGLDLGKSLPGVERLKSAWAKHEPETPVEWRTMAVDDMEKPIPTDALVVVTDANLLAGVVEDIRRDERLMVAIRRLASRSTQLLLQTDEILASKAPAWLTSDGVSSFRRAELALRRSFRYPPAVRMAKAITTTDVFACPYETRGPFPVAFRTKNQKPRFVFHILPPPEATLEEIERVLAPLAKSAIIDLDPIAFFR
ncbi:MAG TPA: hypothetical protein VMU11_03735 [Verrucomicrobiae bacterium]|nr:hypothetical protein [Verrucomicrobiae bacterium]